MSETVIKLQNISKSFGAKTVLDSINLEIKKGSILGLVGKNGAGKSTLIKCLLGLIKPHQGSAQVLGESAWNLSANLKRKIGYVPQVFHGFRWMRVETVVDYVSSFYPDWDHKKVHYLLNEWGIGDWDKVGTLSEGERQKLSIILAMGHDPDIYIFDEPVAALDPVARRNFLRQLIELNIDASKTMLFSSHITSDLERVADEIALLKDGNIWYQGELAALKERVKRVHIHSLHTLPQNIELDNTIHSSIDKNSAVITVNGIEREQITNLEQKLSASINIEALNLEEIFLEINR